MRLGACGSAGCASQDTGVQLRDSGLHGRATECHRSRADTVGPGFWKDQHTADRHEQPGRAERADRSAVSAVAHHGGGGRQKETDLKKYLSSKKYENYFAIQMSIFW